MIGQDTDHDDDNDSGKWGDFGAWLCELIAVMILMQLIPNQTFITQQLRSDSPAAWYDTWLTHSIWLTGQVSNLVVSETFWHWHWQWYGASLVGSVTGHGRSVHYVQYITVHGYTEFSLDLRFVTVISIRIGIHLHPTSLTCHCTCLYKTVWYVLLYSVRLN